MKYIFAILVTLVVGTLLSLGVTWALEYTYNGLLIGTLGIALPKYTFWQLFGLVLFLSSIKETISPTKTEEKEEYKDKSLAEKLISVLVTLSTKRIAIILAIIFQSWIWIQILG